MAACRIETQNGGVVELDGETWYVVASNDWFDRASGKRHRELTVGDSRGRWRTILISEQVAHANPWAGG